MKCPKCNNEIANDSKFCEFCGTSIEHSNNKNIIQNCKVNIQWLLYVAMLFTCMLNYFIMEIQAYEADTLAFGLFFVQLCIFIPSLVLCLKKKIFFSMLILSLFLFLGNLMILIETSWMECAGSEVYDYQNPFVAFIVIVTAPIILFLYLPYMIYKLKK